MKTPRFLGWYVVLLLIIIVLSIEWCSRPEKAKEPSHNKETKLENTIATELDLQESIEHVQDSIFSS